MYIVFQNIIQNFENNQPNILDSHQMAKVHHFHMIAFPNFDTPKGAEMLVSLVQEVKKIVPNGTGLKHWLSFFWLEYRLSSLHWP